MMGYKAIIPNGNDYTGLWCKKKREPIQPTKAKKVCRKRGCPHLHGTLIIGGK
jgi:hypothetical protein